MKIIARTIVVLLLIVPPLLICWLSMSPSSTGSAAYQGISFRWYLVLFNNPIWSEAILTSVLVAIISSFLAVIISLPVVTYWRTSERDEVLVIMALGAVSYIIPPIILAIGLFKLTSVLNVFDTIIGLSISHLAYTLPVSIFVFWARFRSDSLELQKIARGLGANPVRATLTWLMAKHKLSIVSGFLAGVLSSMSEVVVTLYVTDISVKTISREALDGITHNFDFTGFAAMTIWMTILILVLNILNFRNRRIASELADG